jgi:ATP-dependent Clp endopeptidase proteolytic subunit ClpP
MNERTPVSMLFSSRVMHNYSEGWRRTKSPDARFSNRTLRNYVAARLNPTFAMAAAEGDKPVEILLYDEIGFWGVTAKDFVLALAQAGDGPITLRINSPGGDVFDGLAIYNALRARTSPVNVVVDGLAASAASFIAMAGTTLTMAEQSMLMIHNAWGIVIGDRNDMLETAAVMEKIDGQLASIYATKSGKPAGDISTMMDAETWFTSSEAKAAGMCDAIVTPPTQTASNAVRLKIEGRVKTLARNIAAALPAYDPDGDGDNDAEEALGMINAAMVLLGEAAGSLSGEPDDEAEGGDDTATTNVPIVPGAQSDTDIAAAAAEETARLQAVAAQDLRAAQQRRLRLAAAETA